MFLPQSYLYTTLISPLVVAYFGFLSNSSRKDLLSVLALFFIDFLDILPEPWSDCSSSCLLVVGIKHSFFLFFR